MASNVLGGRRLRTHEGTHRASDEGWRLHPLDPAEFDRIYSEYWPCVYRFCTYLSRNRDDGQDMAQEVFVAAFRHLSELRDPGAARTWLYRVAVRTLKRQTVAPTAIRAGALEEEEMLLHDPWPAEEDRLFVRQALNGLPEEQRQAIIVVKLEGLSYREASQVLDTAEGMLRWRVFQGLKKIHGLLTASGAPEAPEGGSA